MCFFTIQATREGGSDFLPVKAFGVPETVIAALVKGADARVLGRLQAGKYDKEKKAQLYDNIVVAEEITCADGDGRPGAYWNASAATTAPAATVTPVVTTASALPAETAAPVPAVG
jgi:single-stranded DNA-binding protein